MFNEPIRFEEIAGNFYNKNQLVRFFVLNLIGKFRLENI